MLCIVARREIVLSGAHPAGAGLSPARQQRLAHHLSSCDGCRAEQERVGSLLTLLASAAPSFAPQPDQFTDKLMAAIQERKRGVAHAPSSGTPRPIAAWPVVEPFAWAGFRPAAVLPALCLMLAAGVMALYLSGQTGAGLTPRLVASAAGSSGSADDYQDSLKPPREVSFSVEEDLVGMRRGTIPLTTYVLEPAPKDAPVVLASF